MMRSRTRCATDGFFNDENDGAQKLPRVAHMAGVGIVRILEKVVGPNTNTYGGESNRMAIARTHAAAASSAPFKGRTLVQSFTPPYCSWC